MAAVFCLWQHRFERSSEFPVINLAELRSNALTIPGLEWAGDESPPKLRICVGATQGPVIARLPFPGIAPVSFLHLRYQISASALQPGKEKWDDGRLMIDWTSSRSVGFESDYFASIRGNEIRDVSECVMRPENGPAVPFLRIEHLGVSGTLELSQFEATVLVESRVWKIGRWLLMAAWTLWIVAFVGPVGRHRWLRPSLAAAIVLWMALYFVVPGPWKILRSFGPSFELGKVNAQFQPRAARPRHQADVAVKPTSSGEMLKSVGKLPEKGDITLRIKRYLAHARPLLHSIMLFAPTLLITVLVGRKKSIPLMALFSVMIECAQVAFGYGFDWVDGFDLVSNGFGIALGVVVLSKLRRVPKLAFFTRFAAE